LYVLEDNQYAQSTPLYLTVSGSIAARAQAFGIAVEEISSNDAADLVPVFERSLEYVRAQRPLMLVIHTYRLSPHSKGDDTRDPAEMERWRKHDPVRQLRAKLPDDMADQLEREAEQEVLTAIRDAEKIPFPTAAEPVRVVPAADFETPWPSGDSTYVQ